MTQLRLVGQDFGGHPEVVGFDIYRKAHGACDATSIRITDQPIARVSNQSFDLVFQDPNVTPGQLYYYRVYGVDATRTTLTTLYTLYWAGSNESAYGGCGRTLLGYGTLEDAGWAWEFVPCAGSCFESALMEPWLAELAPYVGSGTPLAIYGRFGWSVEGHLMIPVEFELQSCTTAIESETWGNVKSLYRN